IWNRGIPLPHQFHSISMLQSSVPSSHAIADIRFSPLSSTRAQRADPQVTTVEGDDGPFTA
ncbi:hypothetical protein FRC11_001014, partial [Ceratobasidium sp. 423]